MKAKKENTIIHHSTMKNILENTEKKDSTKPLITEIKESVTNRISFEDLMLLVYDHPKWQWN
jgi:hypothetical protein